MKNHGLTREAAVQLAGKTNDTGHAVSFPATVHLSSDYFGGQLVLPDSKLKVIESPLKMTIFHGGQEKFKVERFGLYFDSHIVPGTYPLGPNDFPAFMEITIRDDVDAPETGFVQSGDVILEVFDLTNRHVQGRLENVVVEIKMGPRITISSGFFSSPPNKA
ncbi:hypothetical protein [Pseudomonas coleopterorum]|uniref:hypothetical protein n=1 Tax=Pseudomonas coleopterorum TaxID=1605838 RepID=UPI00089D605C|nr:hypothetical protein [Pseudomonas coleopterorum]SEE70332.1 hypothetical protein SAMN05216510_3916 [Pseudomonas coleopterorum]